MMLVLFVTFKRVLSHNLAPATPQGIIGMACSFDQLPCAVSSDEQALRDYAKKLRRRYSATFDSYSILQVPLIEPKEVEHAD